MHLHNIEPAYLENNVTIVCSSDNRYAPFLAVMLASVICHASQKNNYDILVLADDISESNQDIIEKMNKKENISIRFLDMKRYMGDHQANWNIHNREKWSEATYYRMLVPYILDKYEKAVYLDCDVINLCDIAEMHSIDIEGYLLGAVRLCGCVVIGQNNMLNTTYIYNKSCLPEACLEEYFNAGALVMNLKEFRNTYPETHMLQLIANQRYKLQDQDALNVMCAGKVKFIAAGWNWYPYTEREFQNVSRLLFSEQLSYYKEGYEFPKNIHYTIPVKPWLEPFGAYTHAAALFWEYAIDLPFCGYYLQRLEQFQKEKKDDEYLLKRTWGEIRDCASEGKLYLYGYGKRGEEFLQTYRDILIAGIIDQKANEKNACPGIPFTELDVLDKNAGILISPDKYRDIAKELIGRGWKNLFSLRCLEKRERMSWHVDAEDFENVEYAGSLFRDKQSKWLYFELIKKRQGMLHDRNIKYLDLYEGETYFRNDFYQITAGETYVDIGDEKEFIAEKFKEYTQGKYEKIIHYDGNMLEKESLDSRLKNTKVTFMRAKVRNIMSVLQGGRELIIRNKPKLAICVSVNYSDLWSVPIYLKRIMPDYSIYLAHHSPTAELTVVYADIVK